MTKADFIDGVASSGLSKRDATKAVDAFLDSITEALRRDRGSLVHRIPGSSRRSSARSGRASTRVRASAAARSPQPVCRSSPPGSALKQALKSSAQLAPPFSSVSPRAAECGPRCLIVRS